MQIQHYLTTRIQCILPVLFVLLTSQLLAQQDYYWVGGEGFWQDASLHWSKTSGNAGGVMHTVPPTQLDNVFFDANSFINFNDRVMMDGVPAFCNNMDWTGAINHPKFIGSQPIYINGSLTFIANMTVDYGTPTYFNASNKSVFITMAGQALPNTVFFEGDNGFWNLNDDFRAAGTISLSRGHLKTNDFNITCYRFNSNPTNKSFVRILELGSSIMTIQFADDNSNSIYSCNINNELGTLQILSNGNSLFNLIGQDPQGSNLSTMIAGINLNFDDVTFLDNGKLIAENDHFRDVLFMANGTLEVEGCDFNNVEIYQTGRAYSNNSQYLNLLFSTHPTGCGICTDCRPVNNGILEGDNNQIFELVEYHRNGYFIGDGNIVDTCRFLANGYVLTGQNEFQQIHLKRNFVVGCPNFLGYIAFPDTLTLEENKTQTINDSIILLEPTYCNHPILTSTSQLNQAYILSENHFGVDYAEIQGIHAQNSNAPLSPNHANRSVDKGNNTNWLFNDYVFLDTTTVDITCVSPCSYSTNGNVTIHGTGGARPFKYYKWIPSGFGFWQENINGAYDSTFTDLAKQQYSFRIKDFYGCVFDMIVDVCGPEPVVIDSVKVTPIPCYNVPANSDGEIFIWAHGGSGYLQYSINNGSSYQLDSLFTNVGLGNYIIIVADSAGCVSDTIHLAMTQNPQLWLFPSPVPVNCHGDSTGKIEISIWGGIPPYNLELINNTTSETITDVILVPHDMTNPVTYYGKGGDYTVNITDDKNCQISRITNVYEFPAIDYTYTVTTVAGTPTTYCIEMIPTGGKSPYDHHWETGASTSIVCGLSPGTYCDTITDDLGCKLVACVLIDSLQVNLSYNTSCFNQDTTMIWANAMGGTQPYKFLWNTGATTPSIFNKPPGLYWVDVTDDNGNGATVRDSIDVIENPEITATFIIDTVSCYGFSDGEITIIPLGGTPFFDGSYLYEWFDSSTNPSISGLSAGNYSVTITDSLGCPQLFNVVMPQPNLLELSFATGMKDCLDPNSYWAKVTVSGGVQPYTYQWQPFWVNGATTDSIWNVPVGSYPVTVHDANNCEITGSVLIDQLTVSVNLDNVACFGDSTGWANATASGGNAPYIYTWSSGQWGADSTGSSISNLWPGNYTISVEDSNGCIINQTITIGQPANPLSFSIFQFNDNGNLCFGECFGWAGAAATGGTPPYSYYWENTSNPGIPIGNTQNINGLCAGGYRLLIQDAGGCSIDTLFAITQPDELLIQNYTVTNINCFSDGNVGEISIDTVTGGISPYRYSINGVWQFSNVFQSLAPGSYNLQVEDANNCPSSTIPVILTRPPSLSIIFNPINYPTGAGLNNGSITANGSGGVAPYTHNWYLSPQSPFLLGQLNPSTISSLYAGVYIDSIVDANGCFFIDSVQLIEPELLVISVDSANISCFGAHDGWIEILISGGIPPYNINWTHGSVAARIENLAADSYTVIVSDAKGNTVSRTILITEPESIKINFQTETVCFGETNGWIKATPLLGTPGYQHFWNNGMTGDYIFGLAPNQWYVDTVYDSRGCMAYDSVFITENPELFVKINNADSSVCKGEHLQMDVDVFGGIFPYNYSWTPSAGVSNPAILEPTISPTLPSMYIIKVTDLKGCTISDSIFISIDSLPVALFSLQNTCGSNIVHFTNLSSGNGATIQSWLWEFGDGFLSSLENPVHYYSGTGLFTISLTVTTVEGCQDTYSSSVIINPVVAVNLTSDTVCFEQFTHLEAFSLNPTTVVDYWNWYIDDLSEIKVFAPNNTLDYQFAYPGIHSVKVELVDVNGCTGGILQEVLVRALPLPDFDYFSTCADNYVDFTDQTPTGSGTITGWIWVFGDSSPVSNSQNPTHLYPNSGVFPVTLSVFNSFGCIGIITKEIIVNPAPTADFHADTTCFGFPMQFTDLSTIEIGFVTGWSWNFGDSFSGNNASLLQNPSHIYTLPGDFTVRLIVFSSNGCADTIVKQVHVSISPVVDFAFTTTCLGQAATQFTDQTIQGDSPLEFWYWEFGDGTSSNNQNPQHSYLLSGQYYVTLLVTDQSGCQGAKTYLVMVNHVPSVHFSYSNNCSGQQTVFLDFSSGGGANIQYWDWDFGDVGISDTSDLQNPVYVYTAPGNYPVTLTVTNANGCQNMLTQIIEIKPAPIPDFIFNDSVCLNIPVIFTDLSVSFGSLITSWNWAFGDGTFSNETNPTHNFSQPGNYWVTLWIENLHGCIVDTMKIVSVYPLPVANFDYTFPLCANDTVWFTDWSSSVGSSPINDWLWDFGDGNTSTEKNPGHAFSQGIQQVTLTVTNSNSCENSISKIIEIMDKPDADFTYEVFSCDTVQFFDLSNTSPGTITSWSWNFGDLGSGGLNHSYQKDPTHLYYFNGIYDVRLIVYNENGCSDTIMQQVIIDKPLADFSFTDGCTDTIIQFTDLSISTYYAITNWNWEFGDGDVSIAQNPMHIYSQPGTYFVNLKVTNSIGCISSMIKTIIINDRPVAKFNYQSPICLDDTVQFFDESYCLQGTVIDSWYWDFGDSNTSDVQNPVHSYPVQGNYIITLVVGADNGCTAYPFTKEVLVQQKPIASFTHETEDCSLVHFTNLSIPLSDSLSAFQWNFGDPASGFYNYSNLKHPDHYYYNPGIYGVTLISTNSNGCSDSVLINVEIEKPVADFSYNSSDSCSNSTIYFSDLSTSPNNSIEDWRWDFGDGTPYSYSQNPSHVYFSSDTYYVSLLVWNADGCSENIVKPVNVKSSPIADFSSNGPHCLSDTIQFTDLSQSTYGSNQILAWLWDFGDSNTSNDQNPVHLYPSPGTRYVRLIITDANGCMDSVVKPVTVVSKPIAAFDFSVDSCYHANFTDFSFDNTYPITSWLWDFDDQASGWGNHSTLQNPHHAYYEAGNYHVMLVATNDQGCADTVYHEIEIDVPFVDFSATGCCAGYAATFNNLSYYNNGVLDSWLWEFGDGGTSMAKNPTHLYSQPGLYFVKLTAYTSDSCFNFKIRQVEVYPSPVADFDFTSNCFGNETQFFDESEVPYSQITGWNWNFGDSGSGQNTSTVQNPVHQFSSPGTYIVQLEVTTADLCNNLIVKNVQILPPIEAHFSYKNTCFGNQTQFTDLSVTPGSAFTYWHWDFDGFGTSSDQNPTFTFSAPGSYDVTLIVGNFNECADTLTQILIISDVPAVSFTGLPELRCLSSDVILITGSQAPEGTFSGPGITDNGDGTAVFSPAQAGVGGPYQINYFYATAGCPGNATEEIIVTADPVADFSTSEIKCQNDTTWFYDFSNAFDGQIASWTWDFDDGTPQIVIVPPANPDTSHVFIGTGDFNVSLSVLTENQCTDIIVKQVTVQPAPDADFSFEQGSNCIGSPVDFEDLSVPNAQFINSWLWDFGDGNTSNEANPSHQYLVEGDYDVTLQIENNHSCWDDTTVQISIFDLPGVDFLYDTVCQGEPTHLWINPDSTNVGALNTWWWIIGSETFEGYESFYFTFEENGVFEVILKVESLNNCVNEITHLVRVNELPEAYFSHNFNIGGCSNQLVQFMDMSLPVGEIMSWEWDFGDGTPTSDLQNPEHVFAAPIVEFDTIYTVELTVCTFDSCCHSFQSDFEIKSPPLADFNFDNSGLCFGNMVGFYDNSITHAESIIFWTWNFDDPASGFNNISYLEQPLHSFMSPGDFAVELIVQNSNYCFDTIQKNVTINDHPNVFFSFDTVCVGNPTSFFINSDSTNILAISSVLWDFGGGATSTTISPQNTFADAGTWEVTLSVTDTAGCQGNIQLEVLVNPLPEADFCTDSTQFNCSADSIQFFDKSFTSNNSAIIAWEWDFDDGSPISNKQNPKHLFDFTSPFQQLFNVKLTVLNADSCSNVITKPIILSKSPQALFGVESNCFGTITNFTDLSIGNSGILTDWLWEFGDGNFSIQQNPQHYFIEAGIYSILLTVTNSNGCKNIFQDSIHIFNPEEIDFEFDTVCFGQPIPFQITALTNVDAIESFLWDFGNDMTSTLQKPPNVLYEKDTIYIASLTIVDTNGCQNMVTKPVFFHHLPTPYDIKGGRSFCERDSVELSLDWSDIGINYELLRNGGSITPALILPGINYELSFGFFKEPGDYSVTALNVETGCEQMMASVANLNMFPSFEVNLGKDTTICANHELYLNSTPIGESSDDFTFEWWNELGYSPDPVYWAIAYTTNVTDTLVHFGVAVTSNQSGCTIFDTIAVHFVICDDIAEVSESPAISVFPNPAKEQINIAISGFDEDIIVSLYTLKSETLKTEIIRYAGKSSITTAIDISKLPKGIFILKLSGNQTNRLFKVIHQ